MSQPNDPYGQGGWGQQPQQQPPTQQYGQQTPPGGWQQQPPTQQYGGQQYGGQPGQDQGGQYAGGQYPGGQYPGTGPQPTQQYGGQPPTQQYGQFDPQQYGQAGHAAQAQPTQQHGQPQQYGQQQYGQPSTQQFGAQPNPTSQFPQQGDPYQQYGQQGAPHQGQYPGTGPHGMPQAQYPTGYGPAPRPQKRTGMLVGSLVAVIALVAAGIGTYFFAFSGTAAGAPSPKEAATNLLSALSENDMVGLLDGLAPAEGAIAKDYLQDSVTELKRLGVLKKDATPEQITGVEFKAENLVFDEAGEEKVNDRLTIAKLTDGTLTISSDWSKVPLTEEWLKTVFPDGVPENETETIDIGDEIAKDNDGEPIRIATVKVDGEWYPSLFYSIADAALREEGKSWPAQPIAANGADSPEAAVRAMLDAALESDVKRVIELTPPDEMGALHDAGQHLVEAAAGEDPTGITITELKTQVEDVTGGKRVTLTKLAAENEDGDTLGLEIKGSCVTVTENDETQEMCGKDLAEMVAELTELGGSSMTEDQLGAIERVTAGYLDSGVVAVEVDGKWYVSPLRSIGDISTGFLRKLQPGDLEALIELFA